MSIEKFVEKVCDKLGKDPYPYDVTLRAFLIIRENEELYKEYQTFCLPDINGTIGRLIKEHYGFDDAGGAINVSDYLLIKSFTPHKKKEI